ncbi:nucleotide exchange factor GrpE [Homoserinimonas sp. OAct 916]|uniref:nucleotide exchange factor GrpE n=1 Tax=Homoserinimonas sp. OAct 916 TaxID=2211450 RepID=UPI000DBE1F11|nr:nucleotide exchange factor GrpE [Homoserinimonas sp. OAct 916]
MAAKSSGQNGRDPDDRDAEQPEEPIIRNNRKVDPTTGKVRKPAKAAKEEATANASADSEADSDGGLIEAEGPDIETSLSDSDLGFLSGQVSAEELAAERERELKRVQAEFFNYRKAREANHELERDRTAGEIAKELLPVLDDLDRAEKHGDLVDGSPLAVIAAKIRGSVERLGMTPFGAAGEAFDPNLHEALFQQPSAEVEVDTIADVIETGYTIGSVLLRAARVVVAVPQE